LLAILQRLARVGASKEQDQTRGQDIMKTLRKATVALAAVVLPVCAFASAPVEVDNDKVRVTFSDLDIHHESGAKVLYSRLQQASRTACDVGSLTTLGSIERTTAAKACYAETLDRFVSRIDSDALKEIHAG
jgi:UrcA family protein